MTLYSYLKKRISVKTKTRIKRNYELWSAKVCPGDLTKLAIIFRTDKHGSHFYTRHYREHFKKFRKKRINLLEIGVGGYDDPEAGGNSLRMWKSFFRKGKIFSVDIHDKSSLEEPRIKIFKGSQTDNYFLEKILEEVGELSIIIDDGSHVNEHVINTFEFLFPRMKSGGIYVVEDTQTSYWPDYGGSSIARNDDRTIMGYFKSLVDGINHSEFLLENFKPSYLDQSITSIHFYHNLIFVYKGENNNKSNFLINNQKPAKK